MIVHAASRPRYTVTDNATIEDRRLSFGARGMLVFLLSKPDAWQVSVARLVGDSPAGVRVVMAYVRELAALGYVELAENRARDDRGRLGPLVLTVRERPLRETHSGPDQGEAPKTAGGDQYAKRTVDPTRANSSKPQVVSTARNAHLSITDLATTDPQSLAVESRRRFILEQHADKKMLTRKVTNRGRYRSAVIAGDTAKYGELLAARIADKPDESNGRLLDWLAQLEREGRPSSPDPTAQTRAAQARRDRDIALRRANPCPDCDSGWTEHPDGSVSACRTCGGSGIERRAAS